MTDAELLAAFESCTLPKAEWTHEAHIRTAWLYLTNHPFDTALHSIRSGIQKYNLSLGNTTGYHETITVAFARLIASSIHRTPSVPFRTFTMKNPELFCKSPSPLLQYYSKARLASPDAVSGFVEPDLSPLP